MRAEPVNIKETQGTIIEQTQKETEKEWDRMKERQREKGKERNAIQLNRKRKGT